MKNLFKLPVFRGFELIYRYKFAGMQDEKQQIKNKSDLKKKFNLFAKYNFGRNSAEYQTKAYEYFLVRWIKKENDDYNKIANIISTIKEK